MNSIAGWLHLYPAVDVLIGSYVYSDWRPDLVDRVFHFLDPDNIRVSILTKKAKYFATQVMIFCLLQQFIQYLKNRFFMEPKYPIKQKVLNIPMVDDDDDTFIQSLKLHRVLFNIL